MHLLGKTCELLKYYTSIKYQDNGFYWCVWYFMQRETTTAPYPNKKYIRLRPKRLQLFLRI